MNSKKIIEYDDNIKLYFKYIEFLEQEILINEFNYDLWNKIQNEKKIIKEKLISEKEDANVNFMKLIILYCNTSLQFLYKKDNKNGKKMLEKAKLIYLNYFKTWKIKDVSINKIKINLLLNEIVYYKNIKEYDRAYEFILSNLEFIYKNLYIKSNLKKKLMILLYSSIITLIKNKINQSLQFSILMKSLFRNMIDKKLDKNFILNTIIFCKNKDYKKDKKLKIYGLLMTIYFLKINNYLLLKNHEKSLENYKLFKEILKKLIFNSNFNIINNKINELILSLINENNQKSIEYKINIIEYNEKIKTIKTNKYRNKILKNKEMEDLIKSKNAKYINKDALFVTGDKIIKNEQLLYFLKNRYNNSINISYKTEKKYKNNTFLGNELSQDYFKFKNLERGEKKTNRVFLLNQNKDKKNFFENKLKFNNKKEKLKVINSRIFSKNSINVNANTFKFNNLANIDSLLNKRPTSRQNSFVKIKILSKSKQRINNNKNQAVKPNINGIKSYLIKNKHLNKKPSEVLSKNIIKRRPSIKNHINIKMFKKSYNKNTTFKVNSRKNITRENINSSSKDNSEISSIISENLNVNDSNIPDNKELEIKKNITEENKLALEEKINYALNYFIILLKKLKIKCIQKYFIELQYFNNDHRFSLNNSFKNDSFVNNVKLYDICINSKLFLKTCINMTFYGSFSFCLWSKNEGIVFKYSFMSKLLNFEFEEIFNDFIYYDKNLYINLILKTILEQLKSIYSKDKDLIDNNICNNIDIILNSNILNINLKNESFLILKNIINILIIHIYNNYVIIKNFVGYKIYLKNELNTEYYNLYYNYLLNYRFNRKYIKNLLKIKNKNTMIEIENNKIINLNLKEFLYENKNLKKVKKNIKIEILEKNNLVNNCWIIEKKFICFILIKINDLFIYFAINLLKNSKIKIFMYIYKNLSWINEFIYDLNDVIDKSKLKNLFLKNLKVDSNIINEFKKFIENQYNLNQFNINKSDKKILDTPKKSIKNYKVRESILVHKGTWLSYLNYKIYYGYYSKNNFKYCIKIQRFSNYLILNIYNYDKHELFIKIIKDIYNINRLVKIWRISKGNIINVTFLMYIIKYNNTIIGKNIKLKENKSNGNLIFSESSPKYIKFNFMSNFNNSYLNQKFIKIEYFFTNYIKGIGDCYIITNMLHSLFSIGIEKIILIKFEIYQKNNKTKSYKIILNSIDFDFFFNFDINKYIKNKDKIIKTLQNISSKLELVNHNLYKKIIFSHEKLYNYKDNNILKFEYCNLFNIYSLFTKKEHFTNFIKKNIIETKIIIKKIIFIKKKYAILKLEKHLFLSKKYTISIYFPHNKRSFATLLTNNDINLINFNFDNELFYLDINKLLELDKFSSNYKDFNKKLDELKSHSLNNESFKADNLIKIEKSKFLNFKIWDNILNNINIIKNDSYLLNIDNYFGILREKIVNELVEIDDTNYCVIEIFFEKNDSLDIINEFKFIQNTYFDNYSFYIRITNLSNKEYTHSDRISLSDIYTIFEEEVKNYSKLDKFQNINLKLLKDFCYIIKSNLKLNLNKDYYKDGIIEKFKNNENLWLQKNLLKSNFSKKMKANSKLNLNIRNKKQFKIDNDILLYRNILLSNPPLIIIILYNEVKRSINLLIYNNTNKLIKNYKINIEVIYSYIPFFDKMLKLKLFLEIGQRIFKLFKNRILINDINLKFN